MPIGCQFRGLFDFEGVARRTTESKKSKHREALAEREGFRTLDTALDRITV